MHHPSITITFYNMCIWLTHFTCQVSLNEVNNTSLIAISSEGHSPFTIFTFVVLCLLYKGIYMLTLASISYQLLKKVHWRVVLFSPVYTVRGPLRMLKHRDKLKMLIWKRRMCIPYKIFVKIWRKHRAQYFSNIFCENKFSNQRLYYNQHTGDCFDCNN